MGVGALSIRDTHSLSISNREGSKRMQMVGYRLHVAVWQELFGRALQDSSCSPETQPGTQPCTGCGRGVKNRFKLCQDCGYHRTRMCIWQRGHRSFTAEFKRLATIEIPI